MDSQCEWATVEATAYDQYIQHFKSSSVLAPSPVYYGEVGSFGNCDEQTDIGDDSDSFDEFHRPSTPRRLDKFFGADTKVDDSLMDQTLVKLVSSPHSVLPVRSPSHQRQDKMAGNLAPLSGTSVASSLSVTTLDDSMIVDDDRSPGNSPFTTPSKTSSRRKGSEISSTSPKYSQKLWTPEVCMEYFSTGLLRFTRHCPSYKISQLFCWQEDEILLRAITSHSRSTLKWSNVAKVVPGRSGKQCRERYLNHLTPNIKLKNWSPVEDATLFRLYLTDGSKWSMMSKVLRGRTDNGIKNRYHHLKRRLERQMQMVPTSAEIESIIVRLKKTSLLEFGDEWLLKYVATQSLLPRKKLDTSEAAGYLRSASDECCARCGLIVPSRQTGSLVCKTTGWCEVCIRVSPCVSGDLLRALSDVHHELDVEQVDHEW